jgi:hypothetical protein
MMMLTVPLLTSTVSVGCDSLLTGELLMNVSWPVESDRKISPEFCQRNKNLIAVF